MLYPSVFDVRTYETSAVRARGALRRGVWGRRREGASPTRPRCRSYTMALSRYTPTNNPVPHSGVALINTNILRADQTIHVYCQICHLYGKSGHLRLLNYYSTAFKSTVFYINTACTEMTNCRPRTKRTTAPFPITITHHHCWI